MRLRIGVLVGLAIIFIGVAMIGWYLLDDRADIGLLRHQDAQIVAEGAAVYKEHCASCHGMALEGQENWQIRKPDGRLPAPPHDETGHTWHHPDQLLFRFTKLGPAKLIGNGYESDMPGYEDILSDDQIIAVLSYIKSTWPEDVQRRQSLMTIEQHK